MPEPRFPDPMMSILFDPSRPIEFAPEANHGYVVPPEYDAVKKLQTSRSENDPTSRPSPSSNDCESGYAIRLKFRGTAWVPLTLMSDR